MDESCEKNEKEHKGKHTIIILGPDIPLEAVLCNAASMKLFKQEAKQIIAYFCLKMDSLVQMCFYPPTFEMGQRAYDILTSMNPKIISSFLAADRLQTIGAEITVDENPDSLRIGRLVTILRMILNEYPDNLIDSCGFILRLLHHCNLSSVLSLFNSICKNRPQLIELQKWLLNFGFPDLVYRTINGYNPKRYKNNFEVYCDEEVFRIGSLYRISATCLKSPILEPSFSETRFLILCERDYRTARHVEDQKWLLILAYFTPEFAVNLLNFIYPACELVRSATTHFYPCHVYALKFLSQMLKYCPETEELLMNTDIIQNILRLFFQFPDSTFLHDALRKIILTTMRKEKIIVMVVQIIVPALIAGFTSGDTHSICGNAYSLLTSMNNVRGECPVLSAELDSVPGYNDFIDTYAEVHMIMLDTNYGNFPETPEEVDKIRAKTRPPIKIPFA